jgi:hypothetical protein
MERDQLHKLVEQKLQQGAEQRAQKAEARTEREESVRGAIEYMHAEDEVAHRILGWAQRVGINSAKTEGRHNAYTTAAGMAHPRRIETRDGTLRHIATGKLGQKTTHVTTNYETRNTNRIPIGIIDEEATDGHSHGYVEFFYEEGTQAEPMSRKQKRKVLKGLNGEVPFAPTGEITACGVRIFAGNETASPNSLVELKTFKADLLGTRVRQTLTAAEQALQSGSPTAQQAVEQARNLGPTEEMGENLEEIASFLQMADEANRPPDEQPTIQMPPEQPTAPMLFDQDA